MNSYNIWPITSAFFTVMAVNLIFTRIPIQKKTTVSRHPKLERLLCDAICKQLGIPKL